MAIGPRLIEGIEGKKADPEEAALVSAENIASEDIGAAGSITIPGFDKLIMKAGQTDQAAAFYNPEANGCYFRISVLLADGSEIFRSGMIKPGGTIDAIEITRPLKEGTYEDAVLQYDCFALDSLQPLNGATTILDLEVLP